MLVPVFVKERLYVPRAPEFDLVLSELRAKFTYHNPTWSKMNAIGKWTGGIEKEIKTWAHVDTQDWGSCLTLPRGGTAKIRKIFERFDLKPHFIDHRLSLPPITGFTNDVALRPDQQRLIDAILRTENCLIRSPTGSGKCLAPDTPVLLYSGHTIRADLIEPGDHLMGPDSKPRRVLSCSRGCGQLYKITPTRMSDSWVCNEDHILTLINSSTCEIIDISIKEYLSKSKWFKHLHKLYIQGVTYQQTISPPIDPYFVGLWLGDGRKDLQFIEITNVDTEVIQYIYDFAHTNLLEPITYTGKDRCPQHRITSHKYDARGIRCNEILNTLRSLFQTGLHIPHCYLYGTRQTRLQILAGLIDSDGYNASNYYEIVQKNKRLAHDIWFLGRSLGFYTSIREKIIDGVIYHRISICGEVGQIPVKIQRKKIIKLTKHNDSTHMGFSVTPIGTGEYVGWTLDHDGRFLLGDFTVTHNTEVGLKAVEWILRIAGPVLVIVWETALLRQWIQRIQQRFGMRKSAIGVIQGSSRRVAPITVAMQQSLIKQGFRYINSFGGVVADEVQRFAAPTFQHVIDLFPARYRIGFSADESRRDRKEFLIYDAFGEVADEIEKATLVEQGKIHEVVIRVVPTEFNYEAKIKDANNEWKYVEWNDIPAELKDYNDFLDKLVNDEDRNDYIWNFVEPCLKQGHTCVMLTTRREHAYYWDNRIRAAGYRSGLMIGGDKHEFDHTIAGLRERTINIGVATVAKGGTGLDIPQINRGFVVTPQASNKQLFNQIVGRFTRPCEGKTDAVLYYFWDQYCYPGQKRSLSRDYPETYVWVKDQFLAT